MSNQKFSFAIKKSVTKAESKKAVLKWQKSVPAPTIKDLPKSEIPKPITIVATKLNAADIEKLHEIHTSNNPLGEAVSGQKLTPEKLLSTLYTSLTVLAWIKVEAEYKEALAAAKSEAQKSKAEEQWKEALKAMELSYSSAGLPGITEKKHAEFARELMSNEKAFNSIVNIANTGQPVKGVKEKVLDSKTKATGMFETQFEKLESLFPGSINLPKSLCNALLLLASGSFTAHIPYQFSIQATYFVPCPTWRHPFRVCPQTYTIGSASGMMDLSIGYRITCCGGELSANSSIVVCISLPFNQQLCVQCTARVVGAITISKVPVGINCLYTVGYTAEMKCKLGPLTLYNAISAYNQNITAPCPLLPCS